MEQYPSLLLRFVQAVQWRFYKWVEAPLFRAASRFWYGNDAGWGHNRQGLEEIRHIRGILGKAVPTLIDARSESLRQAGYVLLKPSCDETTLLAIKTKIARLMEDPETSYPLARDNVCTRILNFLQQVPESRHLLSGEIHNLLLDYYGTYYRVYSVTCWRTKPVPNYDGREEIYSNFWHCDEAPTYIMKLFVNLSEVTPETGAFRLHSIASTREIMHSGYWSRWWITGKAREMVEDRARVVCAVGPVGSAILCNTELCLHRGAIPREGSYRDIIEFKFEPSAQPLSENWCDSVGLDTTDQRELARRELTCDRN